MALAIVDAEVFGLTESSVTLCFRVEDDGVPVDAPVEVRVGDVARLRSDGPAGTRALRVEGLAPGTAYALELRTPGASGPAPDRYWRRQVTTPSAPESALVASFATLNDTHFGEERCGGTLLEDGDYGPEAPGFPAVRASDDDVPYWRTMNEDAIAEINAAGVDACIVKGDVADRGRPEQFAAAAECFGNLVPRWHAFLGNHDHYARLEGERVDGFALLGQPEAPRALELGGWRLLLLDTAVPGEHHGELGRERLAWLAAELAQSGETPTLLLMHHQPVPPEHRDRYPNTIGIEPADSLRLYALLRSHPEVRGVLIGHTHRNRVRRHPLAGPVRFAEVHCTKDYPGGWAHYRLYADGSFRQEVRRTASERALAHSSRCRHFYRGFYRDYALGTLEDRSFVEDAFAG